MSITRQDAKQAIDDQHKITHGMLLALSAAGCGGIISVTVAAAKGTLPITELLFFRFAIAACLLFLPARRSWTLMLQRSSAAIWVSAFSGAIAAICYFKSLQMMAIGSAMILSNLSLLFIILISYFFFDDQLSVKNLCGIGLMMIAIMTQSLDKATLPEFSAIVVGLLGAFSLAVCSVATRIAASRFPSTLIVFVYSVITAAVVTVLPSSSWTTPINLRVILIVAIAAISGSGANLLVSSASRHIHAGIVHSLTKTSLIWGVLLGFLFLDQTPTIFS